MSTSLTPALVAEGGVRRLARATALPLSGVVLALAATGLWLALATGRSLVDLSHLLFVAACALTGGLLLRARPDNAVGRLLLGSAACFALLEACGQAALRSPAGSPAALLLGWPQTWLWVPAVALLTMAPVFFPDGRAGARWKLPLRAFAVLAAGTALLSALRPGRDTQLGVPGHPNPFGVPGLGAAADTTAAALSVACVLVVIAAGVGLGRGVRTAPPGSRLRQQAEILAYAVGVAALLVLVRLVAGLVDDQPAVWPVRNAFWDLLGSTAAALIPVALGVAIVRHRLFDIDRLISRTVLLVALSAVVAGAYLAVVAVAGMLLGDAVQVPASLVGAGVAAVLLAPVRTRLQRRVDRLLYGDRGDPYGVLSRLGRELELASDAGSPATVAATVREALQLSGVAVEVIGVGNVVVGRVPTDAVVVPLMAGGEQVGRLLLGPRPGEATLGRRDLALLRNLAPSIAGAVRAGREAERATRLAADLQRSRENLVLAREEERRRLRRDFHDGLGPVLAGLVMRAETAREVPDPVVVQALLDEVADDARRALADVRRLVDGLRPPALDALGLAGALEAHLAGRPRSGPVVSLELPAPLPVLAAATEVAAYRIAVEAVANVDRHAGARSAVVRLTAEGGRLLLEVVDDGRGGAYGTPSGVGLASMRERAAELGGRCTVSGPNGGGTLVRALLPIIRLTDGENRGPDPDLAG